MSIHVQLSDLPCPPARPPLPYLINSVAISDDGSRIIAGTYYHTYPNTTEPQVKGTFGTYAIYGTGDKAGTRIWPAGKPAEYEGSRGVYGVAISGDGTVAAAGGLKSDQQGLLQAFNAATGELLLDYPGLIAPPQGGYRDVRVSIVSLSGDGKVLGAVADKVYIFVRTGAKFPDQPTAAVTFPDAFNKNSFPMAVAVHSSGKWFAASDQQGNVCAARIVNGQVQQPYRGCVGEVLFNRTRSDSRKGGVVLLSVAAAGNRDYFVTGGNDYVYYFGLEELKATGKPIETLDTWDGVPPPAPADGSEPRTPPQNVRWVAISGDGALVTAVVNRNKDGKKTGSLLAWRRGAAGLQKAWEAPLPHYPNSTSIDASGSYVVACDGYPFGTPGGFYGFLADGTPCWEYATTNMNWPIVVSANGKGIAGGGDDGMVYIFKRLVPGSVT